MTWYVLAAEKAAYSTVFRMVAETQPPPLGQYRVRGRKLTSAAAVSALLGHGAEIVRDPCDTC